MSNSDAVVVGYVRSAIGRAHKGSLVDTRPDDLGAVLLRAVLDQVPKLDPSTVDDVLCGAAQPAGEHGFNLGRAAALLAGLDLPGTTVTRYCASSLQTTRMAFHAIRSGEGHAFVSLGIDIVSKYDTGRANVPEAKNPRLEAGNPEGLPHYFVTMGETAERVARENNVSRSEMDEFAAKSQAAAAKAAESGFFQEEIVPVTRPDGTVFDRDESPRPGTTTAKLATLDPAFVAGGRVTAGNSCPMNDGGAAMVVMSAGRAAELGLTPRARIVSSGVSALRPEVMGLGPIEASRKALALAGLAPADLDVVEMNEAFAAQVIPSARAIGLDPFAESFNPHGGAIALGHPFGMTGVRLVGTLVHALHARDGRYGLATLCVGGGQGMAMVVERM